MFAQCTDEQIKIYYIGARKMQLPALGALLFHFSCCKLNNLESTKLTSSVRPACATKPWRSWELVEGYFRSLVLISNDYAILKEAIFRVMFS